MQEKEIMAEIQRREEEKREEKRRKEMAKLVTVSSFARGVGKLPRHTQKYTVMTRPAWFVDPQERLESMVQPVCGSPTMLGKSPPSPSKAPPEWLDAKRAVSSRRRTTSSTRHRCAGGRVCRKIRLSTRPR